MLNTFYRIQYSTLGRLFIEQWRILRLKSRAALVDISNGPPLNPFEWRFAAGRTDGGSPLYADWVHVLLIGPSKEICFSVKLLFLQRYLFVLLFTPIVKWTKIHVQIRRFTCCLNMGVNLKILKISPALLAWHYIRKALRTRLIISPLFSFAKKLRMVMMLWRRYDVRKYTADAISFREIQCKKMDNLMF